MATTPPPQDYAISPEGTGRALLVCCAVLAAAAALAVGLRLGMRVRDGMLGWDDGLMALGLTFYLGLAGVAAFGTFRGVGADPVVFQDRDDEAGGYFTEMVQMVFLITMALYAAVLVSVKSAVCILLLRIAAGVRLYRRCILGALAASLVAFVVTEAGALGHCRPIEANWKDVAQVPGATCGSQYANVAVAGFATLFSVATDWFCALFPVFMVWRMPMGRNSKIATVGLLGLGVFASICPLVRVRYILEYSQMIGPDKSHKPWTRVNGSLVLWSVLECGIGLIAASLPAIWHGCRRWRRHSRLLGADAAHNRDMVAEQLARQDIGLKKGIEGSASSRGLLDSAQNATRNPQSGV